MNLRNRFLGTSSFLFSPPNDDGKKPVGEVVGSAEDVTDDQDDGNDAEDTVGDDTGNDEDPDSAGTDPDGAGDDEDPDLAGLTGEARVKAKAAIDRAVARETGWRDRQLNKLHARNRSAQEDVAALEQIADPARRPAAEKLAPDEVEARAKVLATQMSASDRYNAACNDADAKGKAAYGDKWGKQLAMLPKLGGVDEPDMADIVNTDQPHVVLFHLADPETYDRVMNLPPARRRTEFVKLSLKPAPKPRADANADAITPSSAAPPVRPVGNGRRVAAQTVDLHNDKISDDAWYEERNKTRRKKFSNAV